MLYTIRVILPKIFIGLSNPRHIQKWLQLSSEVCTLTGIGALFDLQVKTGSAIKTETRKRARSETGMASPETRRVIYSPSRSRSLSPRGRDRRSPDRETPRGSREDNPGTIFVGNLPVDVTDRRLREFFDNYGRVSTVKVGLASLQSLPQPAK